jgi:hypothetical protein
MKPGRSCSSRSSARPEQGFSRWRTSPGSWSGRGKALAEGHIFVEAAWSLSPARTPLWMPSSRAAAPNRAYIDLAPDGGRGGAGLEMSTTGDGDEGPARAKGSHEAGSCATRVRRGAADRWFPRHQIGRGIEGRGRGRGQRREGALLSAGISGRQRGAGGVAGMEELGRAIISRSHVWAKKLFPISAQNEDLVSVSNITLHLKKLL